MVLTRARQTLGDTRSKNRVIKKGKTQRPVMPKASRGNALPLVLWSLAVSFAARTGELRAYGLERRCRKGGSVAVDRRYGRVRTPGPFYTGRGE